MKNNQKENSKIIILGGLAPMPFELEKSLIKIVKKVSKFDYQKGKISSIDGLSYLCSELKQMENFNQPQLLSLLTELQQYLKYHIDRRPSDDHPYFLKFKRAISEVEEVLLLFRYHEKTTQRKIRTQYDLLTYLIFDEKNLSYIDYIFTHFPYTVNLENNKTLEEKILQDAENIDGIGIKRWKACIEANVRTPRIIPSLRDSLLLSYAKELYDKNVVVLLDYLKKEISGK